MPAFQLTVNGATHSVRAAADKPLLWVLRDALGLKGAKYGCGVGICGSCTVLVDGAPVRACTAPAVQLAGRDITTIEGLAPDHPVVNAWIALQVPQCGYCQPAQLLSAVALLDTHRKPSAPDKAQGMHGVVCRCGTYARIRAAIDRAAAGDTQVVAAPPVFASAPAQHLFDPWIGINDDGTVVVQIDRTEMGQGALTGLAMLVAEELDAPLSQLRVRFAPAARAYTNPRLGEQMTGGSSSIRAAWDPLRTAAAGVRNRLVGAAARAWRVPAAQCVVVAGVVHHPGSGRSAGFGTLAAKAARRKAPRATVPKAPGQYRLLGQSVPRLEVPGHVRGESVFTADLARPGMLWATVEPPPRLGARVRRVVGRAALAVPGVRAVVRAPGGVAVVADDFWSALKGRARLRVLWTGASPAAADDAGLERFLLHAAVRRRVRVVRAVGDARKTMRGAAQIVQAAYETPLLAHAPLEPMVCLAEVRAGRCDVWTGTQAQGGARKAAAAAAGVPLRQVRVHTMLAGGSFGRRLESDFVSDAVVIARRVRRPVMLQYTRGDDLQRDYFRPASLVLLQAGLDERGRPRAWRQRIVGPADALVVNNMDYGVGDVREETVLADPGLPAGAWRSVGAAQNAFAIEGFIDELAHAAGTDPLHYRLGLLQGQPRLAAVLRLAADKANWGQADGQRAQGVAAYRGFGSYVAMVADVSAVDGKLRVDRVVVALDCGRAINPDAVRSQVEGGVALGLSAALRERVALRAGVVVPRNLSDYPVLRFDEMPAVEVHLIPGDGPPGGVGEPGVPPVAPAVVNAIFAATGVRIRRLPVSQALPRGWVLEQGRIRTAPGEV